MSKVLLIFTGGTISMVRNKATGALYPADMETFKGLPLAMEASRKGGSMPTVFNAANERAVAAFLDEKIRFLDIYTLIEESMAAHRVIADPDLEQILETEKEAENFVDAWIERH